MFFTFFTFSCVLDGNFIGLWDDMYVYSKAINTPEVYVFWFGSALGYLGFCLCNHRSITYSIQYIDYVPVQMLDVKRLAFFARLIAFISISAACINTLKAGNISLMFLSPREWELAFGSNVFLNYLYFSHLSALILLSVLIALKKAKFLDFSLLVLCLAISTLHGIKFTILHAFVFLSLALYTLNNNKIPKAVLLIGIIFTALIFSFFIFVRGGGAEGVLNYIISASVNSIYIINKSSFVDYGNMGAIFPIDANLIEKVASRFSGESHISRGVSADTGFLLNNKYNLQSALTIISITGPVGYVFISCVLGLLIRAIPRKMSLFQMAFLVHLLNTLLMLFTTWEFYKFKLLFNLFLMFVLSGFIHHKITFSLAKKNILKMKV
tara:strand:+ start:13931 stop:15073 length:1143 start_codon:yes stop_codon:yes gene_type:complete